MKLKTVFCLCATLLTTAHAKAQSILSTDWEENVMKERAETVREQASLLTSTMRHPFHIRVYARPDFQVFNLGLGYSEYRKAA